MYRMEDYSKLDPIAKVSSVTEGKRTWTELALYYDAGRARPFVAAVWGCTRTEGDGDTYIPRVRSVAVGTLDRALHWFEPSRLRDQLFEAVPEDAATRWLDSNAAAKAQALKKRGGDAAYVVADEVDSYQSDDAATRDEEAEKAVAAAIKDAIETGVIEGMTKVADGIHCDVMQWPTSEIWVDGQSVPVGPQATPITIREVGITTHNLREALDWLYPDLATGSALAAAVERDFGMPARTVRRALAIDGGAEGVQGAWVAMFLKAMRCFDRQLWQAGQATIANVEG